MALKSDPGRDDGRLPPSVDPPIVANRAADQEPLVLRTASARAADGTRIHLPSPDSDRHSGEELEGDRVRPAVPSQVSALFPWAVLVGLCGALGTLLRAALETAYPAAENGFPWTTWTINMAGSFMLGALQEALARSGPDAGWRKTVRIGVGTGVIGGFTTYSTFVLESDRLLIGSGAQPALGMVYVVGSIVIGLLCAALGMGLGGWSCTRLVAAAAGGQRHPQSRGRGSRAGGTDR